MRICKTGRGDFDATPRKGNKADAADARLNETVKESSEYNLYVTKFIIEYNNYRILQRKPLVSNQQCCSLARALLFSMCLQVSCIITSFLSVPTYIAYDAFSSLCNSTYLSLPFHMTRDARASALLSGVSCNGGSQKAAAAAEI